MDMRTVFPSRFLKPEDIADGEKLFTITNVMMEQIMAEFKPVVYFRGQEKGLVLNRTNNTTLVSFFGHESKDWTGKDIILFPSTVVVSGQAQPCIRIRQVNTVGAAHNPPAAAPSQGQIYKSNQDEMNDEIPF
jgi:hypothetical protein